jgi:excisionase family DNA binding protein
MPANDNDMLAAMEAKFGRYMTVQQVADETGLSRSEVYRMIRDEQLNFPPLVHLGTNTTRLRTADYVEWYLHLGGERSRDAALDSSDH